MLTNAPCSIKRVRGEGGVEANFFYLSPVLEGGGGEVGSMGAFS